MNICVYIYIYIYICICAQAIILRSLSLGPVPRAAAHVARIAKTPRGLSSRSSLPLR